MTDLFTPTAIGSLPLPNRVVMAPMTRARSGADGVQGPLNAEYYAQRASAGLIITECTQVSTSSTGGINQPGLMNDAQVDGWRGVTQSVHDAGGRIFAQLWHCGRVTHSTLLGGAAPVAPSALPATGAIFTPAGLKPYETPRALAPAEIIAILADFARAAEYAEDAGFDGVELHGAFGYLPDQFLQSFSNQRTDEWGGSLENRSRFMLAAVDALVDVWGATRVGIKLSPSNRVNGMHDAHAADTFGYLIQQIDRRSLGYVHLMEPSPADRETGTVQIGHVARLFRSMVRGLLITNGGYDKASATAAVAEGLADLVSFGAPYVANPDLVERFLQDPVPLNLPDKSTFYGGGAHGYTDYPAL